ncbi:anti-sigma factor [Nocardioides mesophilus]|uniref:Regulator of SigK n=1 Tax=Nocardioides mesophilus TaxID=433659 RepID=A0A7G9RGS3_9ACTN|nr:anti-sigma factor [Nocardioides mesophilus]QNN54798.1 anti-sigma factor [Nocardioides mesophilus]
MSTELHTLSGAYALDALSAEEAAAFRTHLEACAVCCEEVRELRQAAASMGASEAVVPPASLKARVLAAADRTPQLPPPVTEQTAPVAEERAPVVELAAVRRRPRRTWLAAAAAAVVLVGGGAIGIAQLGEDQTPMAAGVSEVFSAADHHEASVDTPYGQVRVATSPGRNEMAVDARDLKPLEAGKVYQVWSITGELPSPVIALEGKVKGASMPMPPKGTKVAITIEPAGEPAKRPTSDPIVEVDPSQV